MVSLLLVGCWKENDGEKNYEDKPQRAASATMERAMGLLSHLMLMTKEKGDTLLANQKITLIDYDSFLGQMEYEITADDLHITWETMPGSDAQGGSIGNTRIKGTGTVRTLEEYPLVMNFETISDLLFKSTRFWDARVYDESETRFISGAAQVKFLSMNLSNPSTLSAWCGGGGCEGSVPMPSSHVPRHSYSWW